MVWGCMSANGVGNLVFIDGILNQYGYINILKENLIPSAEKLGIRSTFKLYADNDPKHNSLNAKTWDLYNCPKVMAYTGTKNSKAQYFEQGRSQEGTC